VSGQLDDAYQLAMARLVTARDDYEHEAASLRARKEDLERSAAGAVARSAAAVKSARTRVLAAQSLVDQVTADATAMWRATLEAVPRSLASPDEPLPAPGALPAPATPGPLPASGVLPGPEAPGRGRGSPRGEVGPGMRVAVVLGEAQAALAELRHRRRPSGFGYARLAALGTVAGGAGYAAARLLAELGHAVGPEVARPAVWVGRLLALVAPFAGVPFAVRELDRRGLHGGVPALAVVIAAGALVVYGGAALLRG
jgi:hypothetical protein